MIRIIFALLFSSFLLASATEAAVVLGNTFTGSTDQSTFFSTGQVVDPNVSSAGVGRPGYINANGTDALVVSEIRTFTAAPTVLNFTRFFQFTITPASGYVIDFDDFNYVGFETLASGATVGASKFALRSDILGFGSNDDIGSANLLGTTIDLSGADYQGISSPVEFRLYIQSEDTAGTSSNTTYSLDSFQFNGTVVAVPEPSSFALIAIGCCGMAARRRRRSAAV